MSVNIYLEPSGKKKTFSIVGESEIHTIKERLEDTINDIAEFLYGAASVAAPISTPDDKAGGSASHIPSGYLKEHPVSQIGGGSAGEVTSNVQFGGGLSVRGGNPRNRGQFSKGTGFPQQIGHIFYTIITEYPEDPFYAKFVAFGTRGHGPARAKVMKFSYKGNKYRARWVKGQIANPYLREALLTTQPYVNIKVGQLRQEINLL